MKCMLKNVKGKKNLEKIKMKTIMEWIKEAWYNKNSINKKVINKSYLVTRLY